MRNKNFKREFISFSTSLEFHNLKVKPPYIFGYYLLSEHSYPVDAIGICETKKIGDIITIEEFKYLDALYGDKCEVIPAPLHQQAITMAFK